MGILVSKTPEEDERETEESTFGILGVNPFITGPGNGTGAAVLCV